MKRAGIDLRTNRAPPGSGTRVGEGAHCADAEISRLMRQIILALRKLAPRHRWTSDKLHQIHKTLVKREKGLATDEPLFPDDESLGVLKPWALGAWAKFFGFGYKHVQKKFNRLFVIQRDDLDRMRAILPDLQIPGIDEAALRELLTKLREEAARRDDQKDEHLPETHRVPDCLRALLTMLLEAGGSPRDTDLEFVIPSPSIAPTTEPDAAKGATLPHNCLWLCDHKWKPELGRAEELMLRGEYEEARNVLDMKRSDVDDGKSVITYLYLASCHNYLADYKCALQCAETSRYYATNSHPCLLKIDYQICHALAQDGRHQDCIARFGAGEICDRLNPVRAFPKAVGWIKLELFKCHLRIGRLHKIKNALILLEEAGAIFEYHNDLAGRAQVLAFRADYLLFAEAAWDKAAELYAQALQYAKRNIRLTSVLCANACANYLYKIRYCVNLTDRQRRTLLDKARQFIWQSIGINTGLGLDNSIFSADERGHDGEIATLSNEPATANQLITSAIKITQRDGVERNPRRMARLLRADAVKLSTFRTAPDERIDCVFNEALVCTRNAYPRVYLETLIDKTRHRQSRDQDVAENLNEIHNLADASKCGPIYADAVRQLEAA